MKLIFISLVSYLLLTSHVYSLPLCPIAPSPESTDPCEPSPGPIWGDDSGPGVKLAAFKAMAEIDFNRCGNADPNYALGELEYALDSNSITEASYNWGLSYGYFPIMKRYNEVVMVCPF